ncbi:MAG: chromosome segregation protein SMC [Thermoplasmata archaeon]
MYLKRLKMRNFKSFAGAVEIPFEPGFTGVAGPNGMGKSNISDAILFVLGPTSSKALRAERLTHLFFNGGSSKKAATECEVSLVFDNSDKMMPADAAEVEVTRYVKLAPNDPNGYYSYFYVNGRRSTQGEIDSILSHARLSGDGYNLVQQGDVNKVVSMGPVPRRALVERLAGISQFDDELARAESKRTDLDQNLDRIKTILGEVKSRLSSLEDQRGQALKYREIQEEKRRNEARLARADHLLANKESETCRAQVEASRLEISRLTEEYQRLSADRDSLAEKVRAINEEIAKAGGEEAKRFRAEYDDKTLAHARLVSGLEHQQDALATTEATITELTSQIAADEKELAKYQNDEQQRADGLAKASEKADRATQGLNELTGGGVHSQKKLASARKQQLELERRQAERRGAWEKAISERETVKAALDGAERAQAQAEEDQRARSVEVRDLELRMREAGPGGAGGRPTLSTGDLQKELFQLKAKEKSLSAEAARLQQEVTEVNRQYLALDARIKVRAEAGGRAGALSAVEYILSQRNLGKITGIRGTVEELAQYDSKYHTALEIAAGARLQAVVVETDQVAEECIKLLRTESRGRATFLPLNKILAGRPKGKSLISAQATGAIGFALDLVKFDEALRPAFWYVFGETVVFDDLAHARAQMGGVRLVTLTGELIEATGAMTGGSFDRARSGRASESIGELKRIGEELKEKSGAESASRAELAKVAERIRELSTELSTRSIEASAHASTRLVIEKELAQARTRLEEAVERIRTAKAGRTSAEKAISDAESAVTTLTQELETLTAEIASTREEFLSQLPSQASQRMRELQQSSQEANESRVRINGELESIRASLVALNQRLTDEQARLAASRAELVAKKKELTATEKSVVQAKAALDALKQVEEQHGFAARDLQERKHELDENMVQLAGRLATALSQLETRKSLLGQEETRLTLAEERLAEITEALREFPEPEANEKPIPIDELKRTIATLEAQLSALGSVNLRALEEYDQEKARVDEFGSEVERLTREKSELTALVEEIEQKKREKISVVVGQVDGYFREVYHELSAGGEGDIALENPKDPLAGGLLIRARPVGKNVQRLEQLSGGEKSLASLAFIFALQRYDPSPLYVFDEVDMSLDGINAEYVGRMLRRNAERAQFIVISLRKVTLKFAHRLFGVTMRGDGCSRVVGLRLDEIRDVEEREHATPVESAMPAVLEAR